MYRWVPYPIVRIVTAFIAGVVLAVYHRSLISIGLLQWLIPILFAVYVLAYIILKREKFVRFNLLLSIPSLLILFLLGYLNLLIHDEVNFQQDHIKRLGEVAAYSGTITEPAHGTEKTNRYRIQIDHVYADSAWHQASGRIYLYVSKDYSTIFEYGDQLTLNGQPRELTSPQNPGEFDYKRFLTFQNIYHQAYTKGDDILDIEKNTDFSLVGKAYQVRSWAAAVIKEHVNSEREANIALALILGVKDGLTDDIKNAYSASGAMHVLAVSGLHVGIVYGILLLIMGRISNSATGRWSLAVVSLIVLWTYAAITGFSPSVLRAVTMFSFVAVAKATARTTNIYNTLSASALALLIFNPFLIMSVGFQLSYLAVMGIVFIQPKLYKLLVVRNYLLDKVWVITSVSIAAQLATFSLGLLYFHQFPSFFLLSNLVVIPGAFAILVGGLLLLALSFWNTLAALVGTALKWLIYVINEGVFYIEGMPNSLITNIYITSVETWLIMGVIFTILLTLVNKRINYLYYALFLSLCFSVSKWQDQLVAKDGLTFYRINGHTALSYVQSGQAYFYSDSTLWADDDKMRFHVRPSFLIKGVDDIEFHELNSEGIKMITFDDQSVIIVNQDIRKSIFPKLSADIVLIAKGFKGSLKELSDQVRFEKLFLDGSLGYYQNQRLAKEATERNFEIYSIYDNGAIEL